MCLKPKRHAIIFKKRVKPPKNWVNSRFDGLKQAKMHNTSKIYLRIPYVKSLTTHLHKDSQGPALLDFDGFLLNNYENQRTINIFIDFRGKLQLQLQYSYSCSYSCSYSYSYSCSYSYKYSYICSWSTITAAATATVAAAAPATVQLQLQLQLKLQLYTDSCSHSYSYS